MADKKKTIDDLVFPKLPKDFKISQEILDMSGCCKDPDEETLRKDPKLAYLWNKFYGES